MTKTKKHEIQTVAEPIEIVNSAISKSVNGYAMLLYIGLILMLSDIETNPENTKYSFDVKDVNEYMGLGHSKNAYKKFKALAHAVMMNDVVYTAHIEENGVWKTVDYRTYQSMRYVDDLGRIELNFTTDFKSFAVNLIKKSGYTVFFSLAEILPMQSEYSKKIFPSLIANLRPMAFNGNGTLKNSSQSYTSIYPVDSFKSLIGLPNSYQTFHIKRACDTIVKDVNKYSEYNCEVFYNFVSARGGGGKKLTHICFQTKKKERNAENNNTIAKELGTVISEKLILREWWKQRTGFNDETVESTLRLAQKYGRNKDFLEKAFAYTEKQYPDHTVPYIITLIKNGFDDSASGNPAHKPSATKTNTFVSNVERTDMDYEKIAEQEEMDKVLHGFD